MACHACEQRRILMRLMGEAGQEWLKKPTGNPKDILTIYQRLREEAIARGELDGTV